MRIKKTIGQSPSHLPHRIDHHKRQPRNFLLPLSNTVSSPYRVASQNPFSPANGEKQLPPYNRHTFESTAPQLLDELASTDRLRNRLLHSKVDAPLPNELAQITPTFSPKIKKNLDLIQFDTERVPHPTPLKERQ